MSEEQKIPLIDFCKTLPQAKEFVTIIQTGKISQVFNEDAILLRRIFKYKVIMLGKEEQYLKISFPSYRINSIISELRTKFKLRISVVNKQKDINIVKNYFPNNSYISKGQYVTSDDVLSEIVEKKDLEAQMIDFTVNQVKRGIKSEYMLHQKTKELYDVIATSIYKFVPKSSRWLFDTFTKEWTDLLKNINLTRNGLDVPNRCLTHKKISAMLDTLKDLTDCLYKARSFKNQNQYAFVYSNIVEIAKINRGLITSKCV